MRRREERRGNREGSKEEKREGRREVMRGKRGKSIRERKKEES